MIEFNSKVTRLLFSITSVILFCFIFLLLSCNAKKLISVEPEDYTTWKKWRFENLKEPYSWPSVVALHWLKNQKYTLGTTADCDIKIGKEADVLLGTIEKLDDKYWFYNNEQSVTVNGSNADTIKLNTTAEGSISFSSYNSFQWHLIQRQDRVGLRLKDSLSDARMNLAAIQYYPYNPSLKFNAKFVKGKEDETIAITNMLGQTDEQKLEGHAHFEYNGKSHTLSGLPSGGNKMFIIMADATTSGTTYGGGRFLYAPYDEASGTVEIDFNKAENPPCYFTDYATCPLPPDCNKLPFEVLAGEKSEH